MRRKRLWYWISTPLGWWWVAGKKRPVRRDDPDFKAKGGSDKRIVLTMQKVRRVLPPCPAGTLVVRFMNVRGRRYELARWEVA